MRRVPESVKIDKTKKELRAELRAKQEEYKKTRDEETEMNEDKEKAFKRHRTVNACDEMTGDCGTLKKKQRGLI